MTYILSSIIYYILLALPALFVVTVICFWLRSFSQAVDRGSDEDLWNQFSGEIQKHYDVEEERQKYDEWLKIKNRKSGNKPYDWDKLEKHIHEFVPPKDWGKVNGEKF